MVLKTPKSMDLPWPTFKSIPFLGLEVMAEESVIKDTMVHCKCSNTNIDASKL